MRFENRTLTPALSYLHDALYFIDNNADVFDTLLSADVTAAPNGEPQAAENFAKLGRSLRGIYDMLNKRQNMLALRVRFEASGVQNASEKQVLDFMEAKIHGIEGEQNVTDSDMASWLKEFNDKRSTAVGAQAAKASAAAALGAGSGRGRGRGFGGGGGAAAPGAPAVVPASPRTPGADRRRR